MPSFIPAEIFNGVLRKIDSVVRSLPLPKQQQQQRQCQEREQMARRTATGFITELALYAVSAFISYAILNRAFKLMDPNREIVKRADERKKELAKRLGRRFVNTDLYEDIIACDVINPDEIDTTFDSIGGLEGIKQEIFELIILPLKRPNLFQQGKLMSPQKGLLLYGPPGTGKTMLAKAIAKEANVVFMNAKTSTLMSKWFGDSQKLVSALFSLAYKLQPAIIFIDEVESFLGHRRSSEHDSVSTMKTEFMALWDGLTTDQNARVMVIGATNRPEELDEAIMRRFSKAIEVGLPSIHERANILKVILKGENVEENIDYNYLASLCEGYSGSDLKDACKKAAYIPIRDLLEEEERGEADSELPRPLTQLDLEYILKSDTTSRASASEYGRRRRENASHSVADIFNLIALMGAMQRNGSANGPEDDNE